MTNQELIAALAKRLSWTQRQTSEVLEATVSIINSNLEENNSVNIQGFGLFKQRRRLSVFLLILFRNSVFWFLLKSLYLSAPDKP